MIAFEILVHFKVVLLEELVDLFKFFYFSLRDLYPTENVWG